MEVGERLWLCFTATQNFVDNGGTACSEVNPSCLKTLRVRTYAKIVFPYPAVASVSDLQLMVNNTTDAGNSSIEMRDLIYSKSRTHWRGKSNDRSRFFAGYWRCYVFQCKAQHPSIEGIFDVPQLCAFEQGEEETGSQRLTFVVHLVHPF
jgi:hypothetical protein